MSKTKQLAAADCDVAGGCPVATLCTGLAPEPCIAITRSHEEKLRVCDDLEAIADTLPGAVDPIKCLAVANLLVPLLRSAHRYEEDFIFPAYEAALGPDGLRSSSTQRLRQEHVEDECFADEVTEVLLAIGHGEAIGNPEAVGFMLRGFFESVRRHIAFEREHVLPAIGCRVGPAL